MPISEDQNWKAASERSPDRDQTQLEQSADEFVELRMESRPSDGGRGFRLRDRRGGLAGDGPVSSLGIQERPAGRERDLLFGSATPGDPRYRPSE